MSAAQVKISVLDILDDVAASGIPEDAEEGDPVLPQLPTLDGQKLDKGDVDISAVQTPRYLSSGL